MTMLQYSSEQKSNQLLRALYNNMFAKFAFGKIISCTLSAIYFTSLVSRKKELDFIVVAIVVFLRLLLRLLHIIVLEPLQPRCNAGLERGLRLHAHCRDGSGYKSGGVLVRRRCTQKIYCRWKCIFCAWLRSISVVFLQFGLMRQISPYITREGFVLSQFLQPALHVLFSCLLRQVQ